MCGFARESGRGVSAGSNNGGYDNLAAVRSQVIHPACPRSLDAAQSRTSSASAVRGGPRFSDRLLRWSPDPTGGIWNATKETELPG